MAAAAVVMTHPRVFDRATRLLGLGRLFARRGRIRALPFPLSAWTSSRDAPSPPAQTFRQWWALEHEGQS